MSSIHIMIGKTIGNYEITALIGKGILVSG